MRTHTEKEQKRLLEGLLQVRKHVLEAREGTIDRLPWIEMFGICAAVRICIRGPAISHILLDTFEKCPSFSGNRNYPVKHPNMSPEAAFSASYAREMWYEGTYADNRLRLLEEAIEILK